MMNWKLWFFSIVVFSTPPRMDIFWCSEIRSCLKTLPSFVKNGNFMWATPIEAGPKFKSVFKKRISSVSSRTWTLLITAWKWNCEFKLKNNHRLCALAEPWWRVKHCIQKKVSFHFCCCSNSLKKKNFNQRLPFTENRSTAMYNCAECYNSAKMNVSSCELYIIVSHAIKRANDTAMNNKNTSRKSQINYISHELCCEKMVEKVKMPSLMDENQNLMAFLHCFIE